MRAQLTKAISSWLLVTRVSELSRTIAVENIRAIAETVSRCGVRTFKSWAVVDVALENNITGVRRGISDGVVEDDKLPRPLVVD